MILDDLVDLWRFVRAPGDAEGRAFDARFGTETRWFDWAGNYEPTPPRRFEAALDALGVDVASHAFVDLGCGKGRALVLAALRPFREVVGVEHRAGLADAARRNVAAAAARFPACARARVIAGDARTVDLPAPPLVVYLYNPFPDDVLRGVLARVPAPARLVYLTPVGDAVARELGWTPVAASAADDWTVYRPLAGTALPSSRT